VVFREVSVVKVREVLRAWLEGQGLRKVAERAGVDRKTARRQVPQAAGLALAVTIQASGSSEHPQRALCRRPGQ
jgi:hypothetical protein